MEELLGQLEIVDFGLDVEETRAQELYEVIAEVQDVISSPDSTSHQEGELPS